MWGGSEQLAHRATRLSDPPTGWRRLCRTNHAVASSAAALEEISASIEEIGVMADALSRQADDTRAQTAHGETVVSGLRDSLTQTGQCLRDGGRQRPPDGRQYGRHHPHDRRSARNRRANQSVGAERRHRSRPRRRIRTRFLPWWPTKCANWRKNPARSPARSTG